MAFSEVRNCANFDWDEDAVERLKQYWTSGYSARQIAALFDNQITRSAVIGKVHRLKLAHRAPARKRSGGSPRKPVATYRKPRKQAAPKTPKEEWKAARKAVAKDPRIPQDYVEIDVPIDQRKSLVELEENNCKWPIGDPKDADFHFCHHEKIPGMPYCKHHCNVAFVVPEVRSRPKVIKSTKLTAWA